MGRWYGNLQPMVSCYPDFAHTEPEKDLRAFDTGLLSPEGRFYRCSYEEHDWLARSLNIPNVMTAWDLVKRGWVKFTHGQFTRIHDYDFPGYSTCPEVTQCQLDAIFDWVNAQGGRFLPSWFDKVHPGE